MEKRETHEWEKILEERLEKLKSCQKQKGLKSCLPCPALNDCNTRDEYVVAVYNSMNKGKGGGFEF